MSPDEFTSLHETIMELRLEVVSLTKQIVQFGINEEASHKALTQIIIDFSVHLAQHEADRQYSKMILEELRMKQQRITSFMSVLMGTGLSITSYVVLRLIHIF